MIAWAAIRALAGGRALGGDGLDQRFDSEDVDHPIHVVGEHLQAHFRTDLFERPGQEMGAAHPRLEGSERMLVCRRMVMAWGKRSSLACISFDVRAGRSGCRRD